VLYYIENYKHLLGRIARRLILCCIIHILIKNPRHYCSSVDSIFYYAQKDKYFLGLIDRRLIFCCIMYRMINIYLDLLLVGWYNFVLYREWSTFPLIYYSSADIILNYIENDQHFFGLVAFQLVKFCIIMWIIYITSASLLVGFNLLYFIENEKHFLVLIARPLVLYCIIYRMINISWSSLFVVSYSVVLCSKWSKFPRSY